MNSDEFVLPAESARFIAENAIHVNFKNDGIINLSHKLITHLKDGNQNDFSYGDDGLHPTSDNPNVIDWIFIIDTLNFCFWSQTNSVKWTVAGHTGYYGLTAALQRAVKEGFEIYNPKFYSTITADQLKHILRSDDNLTVVPLMDTRVTCLHEVGKILLDKYNGTFKQCIQKANKSAISLLKIIVNDFPCFRDESTFNNTKVTFYKRAQILVSDIWSCFNGKDWGEFSDIDKITMFADYRVPQALVHFGVLEYSSKLLEMLNKDVILANGSREEIEIRGCSIHAVELISQEARRIISSDPDCKLDSGAINSVLIDYFLWLYRRKYANDLESIPFHKIDWNMENMIVTALKTIRSV